MSSIVILITGCSSGIGQALAESFASCSHSCVVYATARRKESLNDLCSKYQYGGSRIIALELNVLQKESVDKCVEHVIAQEGRLDVLINNAGVELFGPVAEVDLNAFRLQMDTNVVGPLMLIQKVVPHMVANRRGQIVNLGSVQGITSVPLTGAYSCTKFALHALGDALRMELKPFGVDVITIAAGQVRSNLANKGASFSNLEKYRSNSSLYRAIADDLEERVSYRDAGNADMDTSEFARRVTDQILARTSSEYLYFGKWSFLLPLGSQILPAWLMDLILMRKFKLHKLGDASSRQRHDGILRARLFRLVACTLLTCIVLYVLVL